MQLGAMLSEFIKCHCFCYMQVKKAEGFQDYKHGYTSGMLSAFIPAAKTHLKF